MNASVKGYNIIKKYEELRLEAYICPAGVPTIGWGHTRNVQLGQKITKEKAEQLLMEDVSFAVADVNRLVKKTLTQSQFDALVSFVFNIGAPQFSESTLLLVINRNPNDIGIKPQFQRWVYGKGKLLPGLITRRQEEADLYLLK